MKKTKILMMLQNFGEGGAQHVVYEQIRALNKERFDVCVLCYGKPTETALEKQMQKMCMPIYMNSVGQIRLSTILKALRIIRKERPEVIHAHMGSAGFGAIWTLLTDSPLVITVHTKPEKAFSSKIEKLVRWALRKENVVLVGVSKENEALVKQYFDVSENKVACVNNGINLDRFSRKDHENFTLINVARQDENKNQAVLLRCFAKLHKQDNTVKLLLLGNGPLHEELKKQAETLNISEAVVFTGNISNTEDYYAVSDMYVQTSHREAMPLSVLEAMAAGLPIVSTDVGGLKDVVKDNGILVPDNDEEALYQAILKIYRQTKEEQQEMRNASLRIVHAYSSEAMARKYEMIYDAKKANYKT